MLEIQKLIRNNPENWETILKSEPYSLYITYIDNRVLFKYRQGISDYNEPIVKEARGLILNRTTFEVVCMGFTKFFLCDSPFADDIDWSHIQIQEKYDGTLITLYWYDNHWVASTTGTIDAYNAPLEQGYITNFGQLFNMAAERCQLNYDRLDINHCYMFELVSPYNQQVVRYEDTKIVHIGTRNLTTLKEEDVDIGIQKPEVYKINSVQDAKNFVNSTQYCGEGFVACDKNFHRVKIKSDEWFEWHYKLHNGVMNVSHTLELILNDDAEEFAARYPQYKDYVFDVQEAFFKLLVSVTKVINMGKTSAQTMGSRKDQANIWKLYMNNYIKGSEEYKFRSMLKCAYFESLDNSLYDTSDFVHNKFFNQLVFMVTHILETTSKS